MCDARNKVRMGVCVCLCARKPVQVGVSIKLIFSMTNHQLSTEHNQIRKIQQVWRGGHISVGVVWDGLYCSPEDLPKNYTLHTQICFLIHTQVSPFKYNRQTSTAQEKWSKSNMKDSLFLHPLQSKYPEICVCLYFDLTFKVTILLSLLWLALEQ